MKASINFTKECGNTKAYALIVRMRELGYKVKLSLTSLNKRVTQAYVPQIEEDKVDSIIAHYDSKEIVVVKL